MPLRRMRKTFVQEGQPLITPHKTTLIAAAPASNPRPALHETLQCIHRERSSWAVGSQRPVCLPPDLLLHQPVSRRTHEHRPGRRHAQQFVGLMHGITNGRIRLMRRMGETADDHWSRV